MCSGFEKDKINNRSVLYNSYYILLYIDYLLFFTPSIISFIIVGIVWVGGNELGTIFVKQRDEYMYRCDIFFPYLYPLLPAPSMPQLCPIFVTKACTHSSLLRFCPDVFFLFFSCKTKTCNIITKLLSFSLPKSELLKTLKSNKKKKKSEMLRPLLVHVKSWYLEFPTKQ